MKYKRQAHVVYKTKYHIVWIPKYRRKILVSGVSKYCETVMRNYLVDRYPDVHIQEISIQVDHVHLLIEIPPKYAVSKVVGDIKSDTARKMRKKFEYIGKQSNVWSVGYFVTTVGANEKTIEKYIRSQEEQDKGQFIALG